VYVCVCVCMCVCKCGFLEKVYTFMSIAYTYRQVCLPCVRGLHYWKILSGRCGERGSGGTHLRGGRGGGREGGREGGRSW